jgi:NADH-quinone oxidoreductase subunit M
MVQKIIFGQTNALTESAQDLDAPQALLLAILVAVILLTGVYPQPLIQLTQDTVQTLFAQR